MEMKIDLTPLRDQTGLTRFIRFVPKAYMFNANFRRFMAKYIPAVQSGTRKREALKSRGVRIPSFITASVVDRYTEYEAGQGVRARPSEPGDQMSADEWRNIFEQCIELGIQMLVLMCGASAARFDVLNIAAEYPQIIFPTVIDCSLLDARFIDFLDQNRNILPVLDITSSDDGEGIGSSEQLRKNEAILLSKKIAFGAYVFVKSENLDEVAQKSFVLKLKERGYTNISYMEHVLTDNEKPDVLLSKSERKKFRSRIEELFDEFIQTFIIFLFVIDRNNMYQEEYVHINPNGDVESYFDLKNKNLRNDTMLQAFEAIAEQRAAKEQ